MSTAGEYEEDPLYEHAVGIVKEDRKATTSFIQRRLRIGYNRAARMMEMMESRGIIGPIKANGRRKVLVPFEKFEIPD